MIIILPFLCFFLFCLFLVVPNRPGQDFTPKVFFLSFSFMRLIPVPPHRPDDGPRAPAAHRGQGPIPLPPHPVLAACALLPHQRLPHPPSLVCHRRSRDPPPA